MAAGTTTLERMQRRLVSTILGPPTFWQSLTDSERAASIGPGTPRQCDRGRQAWNVAGRVLDYWENELSPLAHTIFVRDQTAIVRGVDYQGKLTLLPFMIGTSRANARPTLVIQTFDLGVIGRLGSRLRKNEQFARSGFLVRGFRGGDLWVGGQEEEAPIIRSVTTFEDPETRDVSQDEQPQRSLFGETIVIELGSDDTAAVQDETKAPDKRYATFGAVIRVGRQIFGLTAAHVLANELPADAVQYNLEQDSTSTEPELYEEDFFDLFMDDDDPDLSAYGKELVVNVSPVYNFHDTRAIYLAESTEGRGDGVSTFDTKARYQKGLRIGTFPGLEPLLSRRYANPDMDWALISLENEHRFELLNRMSPTQPTVTTVAPLNNETLGELAEVTIVSKHTSHRHARCSGATALISLPTSPELRKVRIIDSSDISLREELVRGESGSLVVDTETNDAHGLVIASSFNWALTYMMPIQDIFADIAEAWPDHFVGFPATTSHDVYLPIGMEKLRVFILEPGESDDPIRGSIMHAYPHTIKYEYLSYVWEPIRMTAEIMIDGNQALIPASLEAFLRKIRLSHARRAVWADAICIDMSNSLEISRLMSQFPLLSLHASHLHIWLGAEDHDSKAAFRLLAEYFPSKLFEIHDLYTNQRDTFSAVIKVLKRRWFSRRWVVSELVYAKEASVHCGSDQASWQSFYDCIMLMSVVDRPFDLLRLPAVQMVNTSSRLFRKSKEGQVLEACLPLDSVVVALSTLHNGDARDTIYACLALANDTGFAVTAAPIKTVETLTTSHHRSSPLVLRNRRNFITRTLKHDARLLRPRQIRDLRALRVLAVWQLQLSEGRARRKTTHRTMSKSQGAKFTPRPYKVDYGASFVQVAIDFVGQSILHAGGSIDIICRAWAPKAYSDALPSWIKSLEDAEFDVNLAGEYQRVNGKPLTELRGLQGRHYNAGGNSEYFAFIVGRILHVDGRIVDTIDHLDIPSVLGNIPREWLKTANCDPQDGDVPDEFWRTLVADRGLNGQNVPLYYGRACEHGLAQSAPGRDIDVGELAMGDKESVHSFVQQYFRRVSETIWSRRLVRTSDGRLGLVPRNSQFGDSICVLAGCSVPVVLREDAETGTFRLVGECFVFGIMDGEAAHLGSSKRLFQLV